MRIFYALLLVSFLTSCNRSRSTSRDAIRQGVQDYLSGLRDLNLASVDVELTAVQLNGAKADVTVAFAPKGAPAVAAMSIRYRLEQRGGRWVVVGHQDSGHALLSAANPDGATGSESLGSDAIQEQARKKIAEKKYDEAIAQLEAANGGKPSAELKKTLAAAYLAKADSIMADTSTPPRMKYPTALGAYREVLKNDSSNQKARDQISQIESIYRSMGRPIPQ